MNEKIPTIMVLFLIVIGSAGCMLPTDTSPSVDVAIEDPSISKQNDTVRFTGRIAVLDAYGGEFELQNVQAEFRSNGTAYDSVHIGSIQQTNFQQPISISLQKVPEIVVIRVETIHTSAEISLHGLQRNQTGGYEYFEQEDR